jgi:hypothetical protein
MKTLKNLGISYNRPRRQRGAKTRQEKRYGVRMSRPLLSHKQAYHLLAEAVKLEHIKRQSAKVTELEAA